MILSNSVNETDLPITEGISEFGESGIVKHLEMLWNATKNIIVLVVVYPQIAHNSQF
jgi:hypothetical protein